MYLYMSSRPQAHSQLLSVPFSACNTKKTRNGSEERATGNGPGGGGADNWFLLLNYTSSNSIRGTACALTCHRAGNKLGGGAECVYATYTSIRATACVLHVTCNRAGNGVGGGVRLSAFMPLTLASEPLEGSVRQNAAICSPVATLGRYFAFCSSVP